MVDIHCHLLPGIDDGAQALAESAAMSALLHADGCSAVIATPHQRHTLWENGERAPLEALLAEVRAQAPEGLAVHLGAEIRVDAELLEDLDRGAESVTPLAGTRHLLLEFDRHERPTFPDPVALIHELVLNRWRPILAHPELIPWLAEDLDGMAALVARGARFQVTAMAVTGEFGRWPQVRCDAMLDAGLVHFVASDAHGPQRRPPGLSRARRRIAERLGEEIAQRLTEAHPAAVLADQPVPDYLPV